MRELMPGAGVISCMRLLLLYLPLTILFAASAGNVSADSLSATREQRLIETSHRVDVFVRDGLAYYKIRRTFHNYGKIAEEAQLEINLPFGAVATGLRIKGKDRWHEGELMHAEKAEELYVELTGMGPSEPKDPALLYWRWTDELALRVFPIFPGKSNTIEYTLTAPTSYSDGIHYLTYAREPEANNLATPVLRMVGAAPGFEIDGSPQRSKTVRLDAVALHPVLEEHGYDNPKVLVRSIAVRGESPWAKTSIVANIRHTWRGDIAIDIISPDGVVHELRAADLSDGKNNLNESFSLDYKGDPNGTWHLLLTDHHPLDGGTLKQWSLGSAAVGARSFQDNRPASIPQPAESQAGLATIGVRTVESKTQLRLGRVAMIEKTQFSRIDIDVAEQLSALPRPLSVSFVIDASHTMDTSGIEAQLKLMDAYLAHVPWADVSIVAYGRHGQELTNGFIKARDLGKILNEQMAKLAPRNGSFLDRGLAMAIPKLAKRKGSQALILMTDDRLRPAWETPRAVAELAKLPARTVVHVADVAGGGNFAIERDDEHRLFPLAKSRGGVAVVASGIAESKQSELADQALYLVRPNRIDHVELTGLGDDTETFLDTDEQESTTLPEGSGRRWMSQVKVAPQDVSIKGQLWSQPVTYSAKSDQEPFNRATAGFIFSHDIFSELSSSEQFVVASYGRAVSPVTSYLAIEPGVRPSTIGLEGFSSGFGMGSHLAPAVRIGAARAFTMDWSRITSRVKGACAQHGQGTVMINLALQSHEIADVKTGEQPSNKVLSNCIVEALWNERIPSSGLTPHTWSKSLTFEVAK